MARVYSTSSGKSVSTEQKPLYSGGEGSVFRVLPLSCNLVAKIYNKSEKSREMYRKLDYMVKNSPLSGCPQSVRESIVWPLDLLFENGVFAGYTMPFVSSGINLFPLTLPRLSDSLLQKWSKFDHSQPDSNLIRLKICYNLAMVLDVIHASGRYVLVDLKPQNIIIKPNGHFSIIDLDSIQITDNNRLLFNATAFTEDYAPAEYFRKVVEPAKSMVPVSWDYFSYAIIAYQLLLAIHPYMASHPKYTTLTENIKGCVFANGSRKNELLGISDLHNGFVLLSHNLKNLFIRAFEHGSHNPAFRPLMSEWSDVLKSNIVNYSPGSLKPKPLIHVQTGTRKPGKVNQVSRKGPRPKRNTVAQPGPNYRGTAAPKQAAPHLMTQQTHTTLALFIMKAKAFGASIAIKTAMVAGFIGGTILLLLVGWVLLRGVFDATDSYRRSLGQKAFEYHNLTGNYYGVMITDTLESVIYLRIIRNAVDTTSFSIYLKPNVAEEGLLSVIDYDAGTGTFHSLPLGEGYVRRKPGSDKLELLSTKQNQLKWHFAQ